MNLTIPVVTDYHAGDCDVDSGLSEQDKSGNWSEINTPEDNCVFIVAQGGIPSHVGIMINGRCFHCPGSKNNPGSVGYHSLDAIRKAFGAVTFWRYNHG